MARRAIARRGRGVPLHRQDTQGEQHQDGGRQEAVCSELTREVEDREEVELLRRECLHMWEC
jgi:hypothetical protein